MNNAINSIKPLEQPCVVCRDHKPNKPFKIRADNAVLYETSFINNCPFCGRFLIENYQKEGEKG